MRSMVLACWLFALGLAAEADRHIVRVECEDLAGPWRTQTNIPGYLGRGFRTSNAQGPSTEPLTGTVSIEKAGRYSVWARAYEGDGSDRRWKIAIDETELSETHTAKHGERFMWQRAGEVTLEAGEHTVRVIDAGDGYETADAILLTDDPDYDPQASEDRYKAYDDPAEARRVPLDYVLKCTHELEASRPVPKTREEWEARRKEILPRLLKALGLDPLPSRTPLEPTVHRTVPKDGYHIEVLTYCARPHEIVTANVYVPDGIAEGERRPAVICPTGHWGYAKCQPQIQARCAGLAKLGIIAMAYDPIGQNERAVAEPGNSHDESLRLIPSGRINLTYMIWDTMRGIDYLISRPDVDPERIGCTGASGGGLNTIYAAAVDDRIKCSAPTAFFFDFEEFLSWDAGHCLCNHIPGLLTFAGMREIGGLCAPRPQMIICGTRDELFPIKGARKTFAEVRDIYALYGAADDVAFWEVDSPHDYSREMREGMYGFFAKHLLGKGDGSAIPEPELALEPHPYTVLDVYGDAHVPKESETLYSFGKAAASMKPVTLPGQDTCGCHLSPIPPLLRAILDLPEKIRASGHTAREIDDGDPRAIVALTDSGDGVGVPAVFFPAPGEGRHPLVVYVNERDTAANVAATLVPMAHAQGLSVLWVDCRGWGETAHAESIIARDSILLGKPILGQRVRDVWGAIGYFRSRSEVDADRIAIYGSGLGGSLVAMHAGALDASIAAVAADWCPVSYLDMFDVASVGRNHIMAVPDILDVADIAHVAALISPRDLWFGLSEGSSVERLAEWREHLLVSDGVIAEGGTSSPSDIVEFLAERLTR